MKILQRNFYKRDPLLIASELLGKILVRNMNGSILSGRIIEVEAYLAFVDEAAHSFKGETTRTKSLFGEAGHTYIYSIHMQNCMDIVLSEPGTPNSVLIRAIEPIEGIELMKEFRNKENLKDLTSGPGKLCQALNITKQLDGVDITKKTSPIYIIDDEFSTKEIIKTKRVGISKAKEFDYRFYLKDSPYISRK